MMKQLVFGAFAAVLASQVVAREPKVPKILEFQTMTGVPRPYTLPENAIRGVPGGGLPWVVSAANGELKIDGRLEVEVDRTGLRSQRPGCN